MIQYMKELGMELKEIKEIPVPERVQGSLVSGSKISILNHVQTSILLDVIIAVVRLFIHIARLLKPQ